MRLQITDACGLGLDASVSRPSRGAVVPRLGLASELVRFGLIIGLNCQRLGFGFGLRLQGLGLASVSTKKTSCTSLLQINVRLLWSGYPISTRMSGCFRCLLSSYGLRDDTVRSKTDFTDHERFLFSVSFIFGPRRRVPKRYRTLLVLLVVLRISSLKIPKAFLMRSAKKLCIHIRAHIPYRSTVSDF